MKFQIETVHLDHKEVPLSRPTDGNANVFTMLIGRNAVGKTRILTKIANNYLFPKPLLDGFRDVSTSYDSIPDPSRVIAVSNSRFDRFPVPGFKIDKRLAFGVPYSYLGLSGFGSGRNKILSKGCVSVMEGWDDNPTKALKLAEIFDYVGFLPLFGIEFRRPYARRDNLQDTIDPLYYEYQCSTSFESGIDESRFDFERDILPSLHYLKELQIRNKNLSFRVNLLHGWNDDAELREFQKFALPLLKLGILSVSRFTLFDKYSKDKLPFQQASSGQQCMLLLFMGISGSISDGSLVCIDEPEISLHPRWQAEFIGILQTAFSSYAGCHFLIATHSPQIVSGLTSNSGFVADLENRNLLHSSDYAKRSADFQLSEIFHEPGFKNEYLIRILLVLLSKLSKNQSLSSEDRLRLQHLEYIKNRLDESDPVRHLYNQVKMLVM